MSIYHKDHFWGPRSFENVRFFLWLLKLTNFGMVKLAKLKEVLTLLLYIVVIYPFCETLIQIQKLHSIPHLYFKWTCEMALTIYSHLNQFCDLNYSIVGSHCLCGKCIFCTLVCTVQTVTACSMFHSAIASCCLCGEPKRWQVLPSVWGVCKLATAQFYCSYAYSEECCITCPKLGDLKEIVKTCSVKRQLPDFCKIGSYGFPSTHHFSSYFRHESKNDWLSL